MIRSVHIPLGRLGLVNAGDGGSASDYIFGDMDNLSHDPRLAPSLQDLTRAQLQNALDGGDPLPDLLELLREDITGTGAGSLPCGQPGNPCGPENKSAIPTWVWIAGAAAAGLFILGGLRR